MDVNDFVINYYKLMSEIVAHKRKQQVKESRRVRRLWADVILQIEMLTTKLSDLVTERFHGVREERYLDFALACLASKAIHRMEEMTILLKNGYPDGTMILARSLHELVVCLCFLVKHQDNDQLIERYFDYAANENLNNLKAQEATNRSFGMPSNEKKAKELHEKVQSLKAKHGDNITKPFGWAFCVKGVKSFDDMEKSIDAVALRKFRRLANNIMHSNPDSNRFSLSTADSDDPIIEMGLPTEKLETPINFMLISVSALINGLLIFWASSDCAMLHSAFLGIIDRIMKDVQKSVR